MNLLTSIRHKFNTFYLVIKFTGIWGLLVYKPVFDPILRVANKFGLYPNKYFQLSVKNYKHPVWLRYGTSDRFLLYHMFLEPEYACLECTEDPKLIVDCGANVGYSSVYFLNKYPNSYVIAVEPDEDNIKVCEKNLSPYNGRFSLVHSAVWSHSTGLKIYKSEEGDEWGIQVKECQENQTPDIYAVSIEDLLNKSGFKNIDILKIDIEGAEAVVFSKNYDAWLSKVKNLVIELHGEICQKEFFKALSNYNYESSECGGLTICKITKPMEVV